MDIVGLDMLINPSMAGDTNLPNMDTINLPDFSEDAPAPKLMPTLDSVGATETWSESEC